jgi:hypothetical protein
VEEVHELSDSEYPYSISKCVLVIEEKGCALSVFQGSDGIRFKVLMTQGSRF